MSEPWLKSFEYAASTWKIPLSLATSTCYLWVFADFLINLWMPPQKKGHLPKPRAFNFVLRIFQDSSLVFYPLYVYIYIYPIIQYINLRMPVYLLDSQTWHMTRNRHPLWDWNYLGPIWAVSGGADCDYSILPYST